MNIFDDFVQTMIDYNYSIINYVDHNCVMIRHGMHATPPNAIDVFVVHNAALAYDISKYMTNSGPQGSMTIHRDIVKDKALLGNPGFYGLFIYDRQWDDVSIYSARNFGDGHFAAPQIIQQINKFLHTGQVHAQAGYQGVPIPVNAPSPQFPPPLPGGATATFKVKVPKAVDHIEFKMEVKSICDCGAKHTGYKDSDDFAHSSWCKTHEFRGRVPF